MNNRAKCRLCGDIIESFHAHDHQICKCGEIEVYAGDALKCCAKDFHNFLRVDDEGNEIIVSVKEKDSVKPLNNESAPTKKQLLGMLADMVENIEKLPSDALRTPITHYDYWSLLLLLSAIFRSDCKDDI
jgi:hypothetical protein